MNWKKAFTLTSFNLSSVCHARLCAGSFYQEFDGSRTFLLYEKECALAHSRAERGRLRHISSSRECASRGAFLCHRAKFPMTQKKERPVSQPFSFYCIMFEFSYLFSTFTVTNSYSSYPSGLFFCHLHASSHISRIPRFAFQPSSFSALDGSA